MRQVFKILKSLFDYIFYFAIFPQYLLESFSSMGRKKIIKVGYLLSYDYSYILTSLKHIYEYVDSIVISYDINNKTWAGNDVEIPKSFFSEIKEFDKKNKIILYKDQFYIPGIQPMELETRQRNMMAEKLGFDGWHIQIDGDEYAYDFQKLSKFLRKNKYLLRIANKKQFNFQVNFVTLFKHNDEGFFVIKPFEEKCNLITNYPKYEYARYTNREQNFALDYHLIHQSWARDEEEITEKINNWGHKNDFDTSKFFEMWKSLNADNYKQFKNFHPLEGKLWKELSFFPAKNIDEFIIKFENEHPQKDLKLALKFSKKLKLYLKSLF
ncbi:hypothetical protein SAMN05421857_3698 [Chryseobacterium formosense]|uniref:hypothetical protein n=1 Tax=Chryseobacterium formosense TaxID=236814 RepID=UPI0008F0025E|nr:hypothetical protein [Chryseobacterium formosense]SFT84786.1 hypothetical protein SAMN05421857_3698 [Chryseobacterium formosense]